MSAKTKGAHPSVLSALPHFTTKLTVSEVQNKDAPLPSASDCAEGAFFNVPANAELHCPVCSRKGFKTPEGLLCHANDTHKISEKPFPCGMCRVAGFYRRDKLAAHQTNGRCMGPSWDLTWLEQSEYHQVYINGCYAWFRLVVPVS